MGIATSPLADRPSLCRRSRVGSAHRPTAGATSFPTSRWPASLSRPMARSSPSSCSHYADNDQSARSPPYRHLGNRHRRVRASAKLSEQGAASRFHQTACTAAPRATPAPRSMTLPPTRPYRSLVSSTRRSAPLPLPAMPARSWHSTTFVAAPRRTCGKSVGRWNAIPSMSGTAAKDCRSSRQACRTMADCSRRWIASVAHTCGNWRAGAASANFTPRPWFGTSPSRPTTAYWRPSPNWAPRRWWMCGKSARRRCPPPGKAAARAVTCIFVAIAMAMRWHRSPSPQTARRWWPAARTRVP